MKKLLIKALCFMLLLAMLAPLVIACNDDPPAGGGTGEGSGSGSGEGSGSGSGEGGQPTENQFFKLKVTDTEEFKLVDLSDEDFISSNNLKNKIVTKDGIVAIKWDMSKEIRAPFNKTVDITYATSLRFSIYSEKATGAQINLRFPNPPTQGGAWALQDAITIDFTGWKHFDLSTAEMSGDGSKSYKVISLELLAYPYPDGSKPEETLYFSEINVTKETYAVEAPEGLNTSDPAIYKSITDRARELIIGNASVSDTVAYHNLASSIESSCESVYEHYKSTWQGMDKPNVLFDIVVEKRHFAGEEKTQIYYDKVLTLAKGYAMPSQKFYKDKNLLAAIKNCLEYGYTHYYGQSLIDYGVYGNWWQWAIGTPINLLSTLALIEDELTLDEINKYTTAQRYIVPYPTTKGSNKISLSRVCILSAALRQNALDLCISTEYMNDLFDTIDEYADEGGFFADNSFITHYNFAYTFGYGWAYIDDLPKMLYYLNGSPFFPQQENVKNHYKWIIEAFRPFIYGERNMSATMGRNVASVMKEDTRSLGPMIMVAHTYAPSDVKAELEPIISFFMNFYDTSFAEHVPLCLTHYATELHAKIKDMPLDPYEVTKVFGMMSRVVHHGEKYGVCLSLSSTKIAKYECINDENRVGWYHGDGMIHIYTGNYTFNTDFYSFANPYLMPGTTANSAQRNTVNYGGILNMSPYAGGISQGKYGSAGYILDYNGIVHRTFVNSQTDATLYAKKSYFFFDNEIICVGSDISDKSGTHVKTVLDNRLWMNSESFSTGGAQINTPASVATKIDSCTVHFSNMGGYVVLKDDGNTLYYRKATNDYNNTNGYNGKSVPVQQQGTRDFLELYFDHGAGDKTTGKLTNNSYYYAYLPGSTVEETESYASAPDVELIRRTSNTHAVLEKKLGIVAANFFEEESGEKVAVPTKFADCTAVKYITANTPACVMVTKGENGEYVISVSDPTNMYRNTVVEIEIEGVSRVVSGDSNVNATVSGGIVSLVVNTENSLRATYSVTVC